MTRLQPLLDAPTVIQVHAGCAIVAFGLGLVQLAAPKGTPRHRALGYVWAALLTAVAFTSFGIQALRPGHFSGVHVVSLCTLVMLPIALLHARRGQTRRHALAMVGLFLGAMVIAGSFTLLPDRIMGRVVFGQSGRPP